MGYHVVDPDDLDRVPDRPSEMKYVSEAAGMETLGLRRYDVQPGEEIPLSGLHYHDEQEEAFYVVAGTLHVETPEREYVVEADQFFVADPESPHRAFVPGDAARNAVVVGVGAPSVSDAHVYEG
jgi:mannose-6-phosphate isomerase-like protein (cupin superfamily)